MSSKRSTTSTRTTTAPSWASPVIQDLAGRVGSAVQATAGKEYQGDFFAGPRPLEGLGIAMQARQLPQLNANASAIQGLSDRIASFTPNVQAVQPKEFLPRQANLTQGFGGDNLQAAISAAANPILRQVQEQVLPQLMTSAIAQGAYGSSAAAETLPQMIARDTNEALSRLAAEMAQQEFWRTLGFNQGEQQFTDQFNFTGDQAFFGNLLQAQQMQAFLENQALNNMLAQTGAGINAFGQANMASLFPGATASDLGSQLRMLEQLRLNNAMAKFEESVKAPWRGLDTGTGLIQNLAVPYATTTGKEETKTAGAGEILKGILGLGSIAASAFGLPGMGAGMEGLSTTAKATTNTLGAFTPTFAPWTPLPLPSGRA